MVFIRVILLKRQLGRGLGRFDSIFSACVQCSVSPTSNVKVIIYLPTLIIYQEHFRNAGLACKHCGCVVLVVRLTCGDRVGLLCHFDLLFSNVGFAAVRCLNLAHSCRVRKPKQVIQFVYVDLVLLLFSVIHLIELVWIIGKVADSSTI